MSKRRGTRIERRSGGALTERRPADGSEPRVIGDPITVGLDKSIKIDLTKVVAPSNIYDADFAWVEHRPGVASLFFGKKDRDERDRFRTRLELRYPAENLVQHFWENSRSFHERLRSFVELWPHEVASPGAVQQWTAERDHSEWVNFEAIAHAGTEATMDFYSIPAVGIARFRKGGGSASLTIVPVVRVHLTAFELLRLMDAVAPIVAEIKRYLPTKVLPEEGEVVELDGQEQDA